MKCVFDLSEVKKHYVLLVPSYSNICAFLVVFSLKLRNNAAAEAGLLALTQLKLKLILSLNIKSVFK